MLTCADTRHSAITLCGTFLLLVGLSLIGCSQAASPVGSARPEAGIQLPDGYRATVLANGLRGPTQMIVSPDESVLWVAQLNGGERDGTGQIVELPLAGGAPTVLLEGLLKPTGIALLDGALWIQAGNRLLRAPLGPDGRPAIPEVILDDLPFNGRSLGTLTVTPDQQLLYETSGSRRGNDVVPGSATLWRLDPARPDAPVSFATGLKGAYAHTFDGQGRLWVTEIGDDPVNGAAPPDELNQVTRDGLDFGWPRCFGMGEPATNYGGTVEQCVLTELPIALFPPSSTPTSVVESPWEPGVLLVALWGPNEPGVRRVTPQGEVTRFLSGLPTPQHLLVLPDGSLLVSDFATGTLYRIQRGSAP